MEILPTTNKAIKWISMIIPHQPPANTLVVQKLAATLPNSVNMRTRKANASIIPMNIIKHLGHTALKLSSFGSAIFC